MANEPMNRHDPTHTAGQSDAHKVASIRALSLTPWRAQAASTASFSSAAEDLLVIILVLLRTVSILQSVPRLAMRWDGPYGASTGLLLSVLLAFSAWSVAYLYICIRRRTVRVPFAIRIDVVLACAALLLVGFAHDSAVASASTWSLWAVGFVTPVATYSGVLPRFWERLLAATLIAGCFVLPMYTNHDLQAALEVSSAAMGVLAQTAIGYYVAKYLTALASSAENARLEAAREAADEEAARHRALLHDQATILSFIARGADTDPRLAKALRRQAAEEARKVDAFIRRRSPSVRGTTATSTSLAGIADEVADAFPDLDPVVTTDLAVGLQLTPTAAGVVRASLTTLLHNVRLHADATETVVHASARDDMWEVSVADNGVGFDPRTVTWGYGLAEIVVGSCANAGIRVRIDSHPGVGTMVLLEGGPESLA